MFTGHLRITYGKNVQILDKCSKLMTKKMSKIWPWICMPNWALCLTWAYAQINNKEFSRKSACDHKYKFFILLENISALFFFLNQLSKIVPAKKFGNDGLNISSGLFFARIFPCHSYWYPRGIWNEQHLETEIMY